MTLQTTTLKSAIAIEGIGLHSGAPARLIIRPAKPDTGITFKRMDVQGKAALIPARYDLVTETRLGTTLTNAHGVSISTIEHLMAALYGMGVDNAIIEIHGAEVPIMDGSSKAFVDAIASVGLKSLDAYRNVLKVMKPVTVTEGASRATILPNAHDERELGLDITIDFNHKAIAKHQRYYDFGDVSFAEHLSEARTFGFAHEVDAMRAAGLARGGSLENAIVVGEEGVINPEGLRFADEFIRHKALDCLGDFYLAGLRLQGQVECYRPGHSINNKLLRALFAEEGAVRVVSTAVRPNHVASSGYQASAAI